MPEIGDNFYGFTPKAKSSSTGEGIFIGFTLCAVVVAAAFVSSKKGFSFRRFGKGFNVVSFKSESKSELRKSEAVELQTNAQVV
jgi:ABC-type sulfate transport system permease component